MHGLLITAMIFCCVNLVRAGNVNLTGKVLSASGQPVADARISLKHYPALTALTDATGAFSLTGTESENLPSDSVVIVARGYRTGLVAITSYETSNLVDTLVPSNTWIPAGPLEHSGGMIRIKAKGYDFEMGQPIDTVRGTYFDMPTTDVEQPVHTVNFTYDFWMDTTEVTQAEYDSLMKLVYGSKYIRPTWNASNGLGAGWAAYSIEWGSAVLFCNARSKSRGLPDSAYSYSGVVGSIGAICTLLNVTVNLHAEAYRLPTEAEWEYACRAGTTTDYYWGKDFKPYPATQADSIEMGDYSVWDYNSFGLGKDKIIRSADGRDSSYYGVHEVAKKKPNAYGLYDMAGNVAEWCNDWLEYYPWGEVTDPTGKVPANTTGFSRVRRGGNWSNNSSYLRSSERQFAAADYEFLFCGFRVVSSGITSGITKKERQTCNARPVIIVTSGMIQCTNVVGKEIGIYSISGKKVFSAISAADRYVFSTGKLVPGSYIISVDKFRHNGTLITILP